MVVPIVCFTCLIFCPESPVWYMTKGMDYEAKKSLIKLRGEENMDIVLREYNRIALNVHAPVDEAVETEKNVFQKTMSLLTDVTFLKPFALLAMIFFLGLGWTGLPAMGFYMTPLLM